MHRVPDFDHQSGRHCGAAALRNLAEYYDWGYSEPVCFGVGGGVGFVTADEGAWRRFRPCPAWLERAFFENLDVPHLAREDEDADQAWSDVTDRLDDHDPVVVYLDPGRLPYLDDDHLPPHVALAVGYDDHTVLLSDATREDPQEVSHATFREAWVAERDDDAYGFLAVTRPETLEDMQTAATRGVRATATGMVSPSTPGSPPAVRARRGFRRCSRSRPTWRPGTPSRGRRPRRRGRPERRLARRGSGAPRTLRRRDRRTLLVGQDRRGRAGTMRSVADEWRTVRELFEEAHRDPGDPSDELAEAASVLGDVVDREEAFFEDVLDAL
ncbi:BtrH N-terminal domain-containing protein [Haloplanus sp. GCM10025708]|uniref:BtrH N-terminal domain-containing protein n=1 Tax=Haloplanus sp. GCM10025708 TaxID=3252679 RepID=UPI003622D9ED